MENWQNNKRKNKVLRYSEQYISNALNQSQNLTFLLEM